MLDGGNNYSTLFSATGGKALQHKESQLALQ